MQTIEERREYNRRYQIGYRRQNGHYYQKHPGYASIAQRKTKYGITEVEYQTMYMTQCGKCAICQDTLFESKQTHVDHNHINDKVRGLLCSKCNRAMGLLRDDSKVLLAASNYLGEEQ